ncbi:MAG: DUF4442 domain-containing protein [Bacteriovoracaceae bacterium]|jgi:acyl-coenzyme A thioesterase PaaI-like protein|nr:DUF4442 domain-containing protein [Bacteriovoracaceae bacterium]
MLQRFAKIEHLFFNDNPVSKKLLSKGLKYLIPFNSPLGFDVQDIDQYKVSIKLPHRRKAFNHVNSIHACAIATLGELCAGVILMRNLGLSDYRLVLAHLETHYTYQAKKSLVGIIVVTPEQIDQLKNDLDGGDTSMFLGETKIDDIDGNCVAIVKTKWQLKKWKKVKTKL